MTNKIEKRFIRKLLLLDSSFSWLWHREMQIRVPGGTKKRSAGDEVPVTKGHAGKINSRFRNGRLEPQYDSAAGQHVVPPSKAL